MKMFACQMCRALNGAFRPQCRACGHVRPTPLAQARYTASCSCGTDNGTECQYCGETVCNRHSQSHRKACEGAFMLRIEHSPMDVGL